MCGRQNPLGCPPSFRFLSEDCQVIGLLYVLFPLLLHIWKVVKVQLDLNGRSKVYLQTSATRHPKSGGHGGPGRLWVKTK